MTEPDEGAGALSSLSPAGKKLKQARLPFAPVNKTQNKEVERKRKLSGAGDVTEPNKQVKLAERDEKEEHTTAKIVAETETQSQTKEESTGPLKSDTKTKLSSFACTSTQEKENVAKPRQVKPKKAKKKVEPEQVVLVEEESLQERPDNMKGRVKMDFKKNKNRRSEEKKKDDSDVEILEDFDVEAGDKQTQGDNKNTETDVKIVESIAATNKGNEKTKVGGEEKKQDVEVKEIEDTSMTDEWAQYHEKEMEKNPVEPPNSAIEKLVTPKSEKKKSVSRKPTSADGKKKEAKEKTSNEKAVGIETAKPEQEVTVKKNPLAKFLVKMSPGSNISKKAASVKTPKEQEETTSDEVCIVDEVVVNKSDVPEATPEVMEVESVATETKEASDPVAEEAKGPVVDTTPKVEGKSKCVEKESSPSQVSTPGPSAAGTPKNPASVRAKQMAVAKLKVTIQELVIEMEAAVEKEEFLKAHELKQKIAGVESEVSKIQTEQEFVAYSPTTQGILSSLSSTPVQNSLVSSKGQTPDVKTPSSAGLGKVETPVGTADINKTPKSSQTKKPKVKKVTTPGSVDTTPKAPKPLTPKQLAIAEERRKKQLQLEEEKEKKRKEKEVAKQDKERQKEIDKRVKEIERMEKERQKREKEREKEKEKKEKEEEKQRKKDEKEAEMKKKEEEKAKAEEAKRKAEEIENEKKRKAAAAFKGFFVKKEAPKVEVESTEDNKETEAEAKQFNPFQVKQNMRLAPLTRADPLNAKNSLDSLEGPSGPENLYLELLKSGGHQPEKQGKTWPWTKAEEDEVQILEDDDDDMEDEDECEDGLMILGGRAEAKQHRAKLFQFHENQRPAYWGTWRKRSKCVTGRKPFGQDKVFDYEYDSDEDWEDEGEGESLSDAEDEKEEEDEYEVDNDFFVPHGYLSDGEEDKDDDEVFNPELEKEKLKLKEKEFEREIKKKTQQLKPRLWGCYWEPVEMDTETAAVQLVKVLSGYAAIPCCNNNLPIKTSISHPQTSPVQSNGDDVTESAKTKAKVKVSKVFPEEALGDLVRLTHMNVNNKIFLAKEFIQFWSGKNLGEASSNEISQEVNGSADGGASMSVQEAAGGTPGGPVQTPATPTTATPSSGLLSKKKVIDKIQEIADYKKVEGRSGKFWVVKQDILAQVNYENTDTNSWTYILEQPNNKQNGEDQTPVAVGGPASRPQSPVQSKTTSPNRAQLITKFTKVLSEDERARLNSTPPSNKKAKPNKQNGPAVPKTKMVAGVNMIQVKRAPGSSPAAGSASPGTSAAATSSPLGQVNKIAVKRKAGGGKSPAVASSVIPVKRKPAVTGPSVMPVNKIQVKKSPGTVNQIAVKKSPGGAAGVSLMAQLKKLPGVSVQKVSGDSAVGSSGGAGEKQATVADTDCITID